MPGDGILCFAVSLLTHAHFKRALRGASYTSRCLMHCKSRQYLFFFFLFGWALSVPNAVLKQHTMALELGNFTENGAEG